MLNDHLTGRLNSELEKRKRTIEKEKEEEEEQEVGDDAGDTPALPGRGSTPYKKGSSSQICVSGKTDVAVVNFK